MTGLWDAEAEQAVLGEVMRVESPNAYATAARIVGDADWWQPRHALVWAACTALVADGIPVDPVLVAERLTLTGDYNRAGGADYLHTLYAAASGPALQWHAGIVADCATRRRIKQAGEKLMQRAEAGDVEPAELVQWAGDTVAAARDDRVGVDVLTVDYDTFQKRTAEIPNPVIPGLLGEGDRIILTGVGGIGKSTLLTQIALCAAAGLPPLDYQTEDPYDPVRVTIIDCENPDHRRKARQWPIVAGLKNLGLDPRPQLRLGGTGTTMDLLNPREALSLLRTIEHDKPQLAYIGPVYKLHNDDPDKELVVKRILHVLESIREMGVAIIAEAHTTKEGERPGGVMKPAGSNIWSWWPEYGVGLRPDPDSDEIVRRCKLERWRIDREDSAWPRYVQASGDPALPWMRAPELTPTFAHEPQGGRGYAQPSGF